eukprot:562736_1
MAFEGPVQNNCCMHLWNSRNDPDFCDVTFVVGKEETEFNAHSAIVASCSPVLKNLLFWCGKKDESKETNPHVKLQQDDPIAFETMLLKCVKFSKRDETVLSEYCDSYLTQNISVSNVCVLFDEAVKSKMCACILTVQTLLEQSALARSTQTIVNSNDFCNMSLEAMQIFLQMDFLQISEENLWDAVLRWVDNQFECQSNDDDGNVSSHCIERLPRHDHCSCV